MNCPLCNSDQIHRSPRKTLGHKILSLFNKWPYRCYICGHRFYLMQEKRDEGEATPPLQQS